MSQGKLIRFMALALPISLSSQFFFSSKTLLRGRKEKKFDVGRVVFLSQFLLQSEKYRSCTERPVSPSFKPGLYKLQQTVLALNQILLTAGTMTRPGFAGFLMWGRAFLFDQYKSAMSIIRELWVHPVQPKHLWGLNGSQRGR